MRTTGFLFLLLYIIASILHLIASWKDDRKKRAATKPFLLIFLLLFYVFCSPKIFIALVLALLTSWLGDVLLIPNGHGWFTAGGISFMASHVFFIMVYLEKISVEGVIWWIVIPAAVLYFGISFNIIHITAPTTPKKMVLPMHVYLLLNSTMNIFALMQLMNNPCRAAWIAYIGAVLFFISDCTLFLVRYSAHPERIFKKHFSVMLTYLLGEAMITIGVMMLHGFVWKM